MNRKSMILLGMMFTLFVASQFVVAEAHSPGPMTLEYDMDTDVLTVTVVHVTSDVNSHYIYEIVVEKNSVQVDIESYTSQSDASQVIETFTVPAEEGDILSVTAKCSVSGQRTEELTVGSPSTTTSSNGLRDSTILMIFVATAIIGIGIVLVIVLVIKRR